MKEILKYLRQTHGFTQEEIAEKLTVSRQSYSKYEKGSVEPNPRVLQELARIYGVSVEFIRQNRIPHMEPKSLYPADKDTGDMVAAEPWFDWTGPFNTYRFEGVFDGTAIRILSFPEGVQLKKGQQVTISFDDGRKTRESREEILEDIMGIIHRGTPCTRTSDDDPMYKNALAEALEERYES